MKQKEINQFLLSNYKHAKYPLLGQHHLIQYYSHNEGNYVIIAKSESAAIRCLDELNNYKDGYLLESVKFAEKVDIVSYPKRLFLSWAQKQYKTEKSCWVGELSEQACKLYEAENKIVSPFLKCNNYKPSYRIKKSDDDYDKHLENHWVCENCQATKMVFLPEIDIDALYIKNAPKRNYLSVFSKELPTHAVREIHGLEVDTFCKEEFGWKQPVTLFNIVPSDFSKIVAERMDLYEKQEEIKKRQKAEEFKRKSAIRKQKEVLEIKESFTKIFEN